MASYKYQFAPPDDVICPLCLDIVEEPHQFTCCGQHICKKCGNKLKQQDTTPQCPLCRHSEYGTVPDKYFERNILNKLLIWCTEGCGQKVELGQLKNHLSQCHCVQDNCPYGCSQQYQCQYIEEHKEKCPKRPFICGYCKYQSTYEVIVNEHYPVCDKYPIICPNMCSGDEIERGMLQDHLDKCPFQVVYCLYGCGLQYQRQYTEKHNEKCTERCGLKVELGQLKNNLPQCSCVHEDCPYGCGQQHQCQYIEEHKEKCPRRPFVFCSKCKLIHN